MMFLVIMTCFLTFYPLAALILPNVDWSLLTGDRNLLPSIGKQSLLYILVATVDMSGGNIKFLSLSLLDNISPS